MSNKKPTAVEENSCDGSYRFMPVDNPVLVEKVKQVLGFIFTFLGYMDLLSKGWYVLVA